MEKEMQVNNYPPTVAKQTYKPNAPHGDTQAFSEALNKLGVQVDASALAGLERADAAPFAMVDMGNGLFFMQLEAVTSNRQAPDKFDTFIFDSKKGELTESNDEIISASPSGINLTTCLVGSDKNRYCVTMPINGNNSTIPAEVNKLSMPNGEILNRSSGTLVNFFPVEE